MDGSLLSPWRRALAGPSLTLLLVACSGASEADANRPTVVRTVPSNGEHDVDSELGALSVTFSEAMGDGWSWVTETGHAAPEVQGFAFYIDDLTNVLPVKLAPHTNYAIWVNSPDHEELRKFANTDGVSARAYRIQFETR
ncbi:MAG TPA: Ig-like domain-containing protein [Polyangiaceae bacterium]|nr:Ig-like domain-containing protein [Polyangiaceae bacterium]